MFVEEYSREARLLRDAYANGLVDLAAPSLLPYEVINALKYSGAFGEDELKEVAKALEDYQFTPYDLVGEVAQKTLEIAMRKGVTVYDAAYVALAHKLGTVLYTADEKLLRKVERARSAYSGVPAIVCDHPPHRRGCGSSPQLYHIRK